MFGPTALAVLLPLIVPTSAHGQDRPPVAFDQHVTFANAHSFGIRLTYYDPDGDRLSPWPFSIETFPEHLTIYSSSPGIFSCAGLGECGFFPASGFTGTDSLTFTVTSCHNENEICTTSASEHIAMW
jgi:hypothetical protein